MMFCDKQCAHNIMDMDDIFTQCDIMDMDM